MLDLDLIVRHCFEKITSLDVQYPHGVMHVNFENEVRFASLCELDLTQPKDMLLALEHIRNCGNSKVECVLEHNQDVLDGDPGLREAVERGDFTTTRDIDEYINSLKKEMEVH